MTSAPARDIGEGLRGRDFAWLDDPIRIVPYATSEFKPIGGVIKQRPEDFLVEETPLYHPSGQGEHIYLFIEKKLLTTQDVVNILAKHFGVKRMAIGYAGMKDRFAITRQVFSIHTPGRSIEDFPDLRAPGVSILWADMHANKLRLGHLRTNRFSIRIRGVDAFDVRIADAIVRRISHIGVPNLFMEQRFGAGAINHELGRLLVLGQQHPLVNRLLGPNPHAPTSQHRARELYAAQKYEEAIRALPNYARAERNALRQLARGVPPKRIVYSIPKNEQRLWVSAFQSAVFNQVLAKRMHAGALTSLVPGDLAYRHDRGAVFRVDDSVVTAAETASRLEALEISPSGPIWGHRMTTAEADTGSIEAAALNESGVTVEHLARFSRRAGKMFSGARRPLRVPIIDPEVEGGADEHGQFIRIAFELPPGSFATAVVRELCKHPDGRVKLGSQDECSAEEDSDNQDA